MPCIEDNFCSKEGRTLEVLQSSIWTVCRLHMHKDRPAYACASPRVQAHL